MAAKGRAMETLWESITCAQGHIERVEAKRRRSTLLARDLQKRLNAEHRLVDRANERRIKAEQERDAARHTPTYFDEVGIERRDAATVAFQQGRHAIDKAEGWSADWPRPTPRSSASSARSRACGRI